MTKENVRKSSSGCSKLLIGATKMAAGATNCSAFSASRSPTAPPQTHAVATANDDTCCDKLAALLCAPASRRGQASLVVRVHFRVQAEEFFRFETVVGLRVVIVALALVVAVRFNFRAAHQWHPRSSERHDVSMTTTLSMGTTRLTKKGAYTLVLASCSEAGQASRVRVGAAATRALTAALALVHIRVRVEKLSNRCVEMH